MKPESSVRSSSIQGGCVGFYTIPTDLPEADGTFAWKSTSMVLVQLQAQGSTGVGYTYADRGTFALADTLFREIVQGSNPFDRAATLERMLRRIRNLGETGCAMMAVSAIDNALWDLTARILDVPLVQMLGQVRESIAVYGSGGFTSYTDQHLAEQLGGWSAAGFARVKMKIGTDPERDPARVRVAREAIGPGCELFVDANGAYTVTQAIALAHRFAEQQVAWFEEPVSSDHLIGLDQVRQHAPLGMDIAAGEYGYTAWYFRRMLDAQAVTVLQADCTRCGGVSGFLQAAGLCWAHNIPLSAHCGPSIHLHLCCSVPRAVHMEFFHDHARIERMFFEGFREPRHGRMFPDLSAPGNGLVLKKQDVEQYRA